MTQQTLQRSRVARSDVMPVQALLACIALLSGMASLILAWHHPLAPIFLCSLVVACWAVFFVWPSLWLLVLPATLPLIGLMPWTGWVSFEELDILILAVAAGSYARLLWRTPAPDSHSAFHFQRRKNTVVAWALIFLFALSTLIAMWRGMADAGGFVFGWFQGYHEPMNSLRLAKSFFLALLLLPLWSKLYKSDPTRAQNLLSYGLIMGLSAAALATIWERAAFTDLLNFSADYRTTGLFWEMHVGGAALDGFLVLTLPFALRAFMFAHTRARWGVTALALGLATYSCLTTFSRGVYLAAGVSTALFLGLHFWRSKRNASDSALPASRQHAEVHLSAALFLLVGFGVAAAWIFPTSGYRGMAALLSTLLLILPLAKILRGFSLKLWLLGGMLGLLGGLLSLALAWLLPKGAYLAWGAALIATLSMLALNRRAGSSSIFTGPLAFAGFCTTALASALIAQHWGGAVALQAMLPALFFVLGLSVLAAAAPKPLWPERLRWQASVAGVMILLAAVVGVMGGGVYMSKRFSTGSQDLEDRLGHWRLGQEMLTTQSDWWLGKGLGRFPANYSLFGKIQEHTGDYRIRQEVENTFLSISGGLHVLGYGEFLRVSQRVAAPVNTAMLTAMVRAEKDVSLHFEVCQKHLLYDGNCISKNTNLKGAPGVWQSLQLKLEGKLSSGDWYAPRMLAFSMAVATRGGVADLDRIALTSADGRQLLENGDFSEQTAHWFFSSDRYHLPWHIKNIFMNVLFDQGIFGLTIWSLILLAALWRLGLGSARRHPMAPVLLSSLVGFVLVGLFDSLLDVPRLSWLFYLLVLIALTLRPYTLAQPPSLRR